MNYLLYLLFWIVCDLTTQTGAISFLLEPDSRKCIREEVHKDVLVVGEYELEVSHYQKTDIEVSIIYISHFTVDYNYE